MKRPSRPPQKAPPNLYGVVPAKREEPVGPLVPFVEVVSKPKKAKKPRTPINKRNDARMEERNEAAFGPSARMARTMRCARCRRPPPSEPAHIVSRGAGGLDEDNVFPACHFCHAYQHQIGIKDFERKSGLDLLTIAKEVTKLASEHDCSLFLDEAGRFCGICEERIDGKGGVR